MLLFSGNASVKGLALVTGRKGERCTAHCDKYNSFRREKLNCNDSGALSSMCPVERAGMRNTLFSNKCTMCVCVCACVRACVRVCVRAYVCVCARALLCVCENYGLVPYTVKINGSCLCTNVVTQFYIKFHCKSFRN